LLESSASHTQRHYHTMKSGFLVVLCTILSVNAGPAKDLLHAMQRNIPKDVQQWMVDQDSKVKRQAGMPHIVVAGDSWADVVGEGGAQSFLLKRLTAHGCNATSSNIAIPGTTSGMWATAPFLAGAKLAAKGADYVYMMLGGNDCLDLMPDCAQTKKSAAECGDQLVASATANVNKLVAAIHEANPKTRVVGFGYDTMFGATGCGAVTHEITPQCWAKGVPAGSGNRCFNTEFVKIQGVFDTLAKNYSFFDEASILGATQVAGGDAKASTDPGNRHIDMDKMGPAKFWPLSGVCFHPGFTSCDDTVNSCGANVVMEEFYKVYWSKQPSVCPSTNIVV